MVLLLDAKHLSQSVKPYQLIIQAAYEAAFFCLEFSNRMSEEHPNNPKNQSEMVVIPKEEFEDLLDRAAERGAEKVLAHLGLENGHAARDIRELRNLLDAWRDTRKTAWQTIIKVATTGALAVLLMGVAVKLKLFGGQ